MVACDTQMDKNLIKQQGEITGHLHQVVDLLMC